MGDTVSACVQLRDRDQRHLEPAFGYRRFLGKGETQSRNMSQRRRAVCQHLHLVEERTVRLPEELVNLTQIFWYFVNFNVADACDEAAPLPLGVGHSRTHRAPSRTTSSLWSLVLRAPQPGLRINR